MKLKVVIVNILVFAGMLLALNLLCWFVFNQRYRTIMDQFYELPNYQDKEYARQIYDEYYALPINYEPYTAWTSAPYEGTTVNINPNGDRVTGTSPDDMAGKKVVRFFGGSVMWGFGNDDKTTIPALYRDLHADYAVFNHAESGHNSRQALIRLVNLLTLEEPVDVVVFYVGVNEVLSMCRSEVSVPGHLKEGVIAESVKRKDDQSILKEAAKILTFKYVFEMSKRLRNKLGNDPAQKAGYECAENADRTEKIATAFINNLKIAHDLATAQGATFIAFLEPVVFFGNAKKDHLQAHLDRNVAKADIFKATYPLIKQKLVERNYNWVYDLEHIFDRDEYIYIDFCHISPNGNKIVVREIDSLLDIHNSKITEATATDTSGL